MITRIDEVLIDAVCAEAAASPRRRKNRNFHRDNEQPGHRLLNAMMADSYIPPHRHLDPSKDETMVMLRGAMAVIEFDETGAVIDVVKVSRCETAAGAVNGSGVDIPHGVWHTVVALTDDTVFLEAKAGPYRMLLETERAPWAPAEGVPEACDFLEQLRRQCAAS